jgi:hypothetical protein
MKIVNNKNKNLWIWNKIISLNLNNYKFTLRKNRKNLEFI